MPNTPHNNPTVDAIAVVGLGAMGVALTRSLLEAGRDVTVWNRSPRDLAALGIGAARSTPSPAECANGAGAVVVCVLDDAAARAVIDELPVTDTPIVNLTSATPVEAAARQADMHCQGRRSVTGAIMVPTPLIGTPHCHVLYAGAPDVFDDVAPLLAPFGGRAEYLGEDPAMPAVLDMAMLDIFFAGAYAFLHAAAVARAYGVEPNDFLPYAEGVVATLTSSLPGLASSFHEHRYDDAQARTDMCARVIRHIVESTTDAGVDPTLPATILQVSQRAVGAGHDADDWGSIAEFLTTA